MQTESRSRIFENPYFRPTLLFTQEECDAIDWDAVFGEWDKQQLKPKDNNAMKISDLIETLEKIKQEHGDIAVLSNDIDYSSVPIDKTTLRKNDDGKVDGVHLGD